MVETATLQNIETFGAGIVALGIVFGIVFFTVKEFIPALKKIGDSLSQAVGALGVAIDILNKTMLDMQAASIASMGALEKRIMVMETKLDYHVEAAMRIESSVQSALSNTTEIKERVRNCTNTREPQSRTRKEDKL